MGKKFGTNSKAEEGRARKVDSKEQQKEKNRLEKEKLEEKKWLEGSKDDSKRQQEEVKRLEKLIKKQEKKEIEAQEIQELSKYKASSSPSKPTPESNALFKSKSSNWTLSLSSDGDQSSESVEKFSASNMDDALLLLESTNISSTSISNIEKHPERRMRAAFSLFEAREMPKLRAENPSLKHSQLLERLHKIWKKSPENPFNQLHVAHNMTQEQQVEVVKADQNKNLDRLRIN